MAQPTGYNRLYNLTDYASDNPAAQYNAAYVDAELNAIELTLDEILANLAIIQRDDTLLRNLSVHPDALSTATKALIGAGNTGQNNWTPRGTWVTSTAYVVGDVVERSGASYVCAVAHTSGTFTTDYSAGDWISLSASVNTLAMIDTNLTITGSSDATKVARFEVDTNISAGTTRVFTFPDRNGTVATLEGNQTFSGNIVIAGNTTLGDASGDTVTLNAGTVTINNNYVATRASGAATAGTTKLLEEVYSFTGDSGGSTSLYGRYHTLTASGANAINFSIVDRSVAIHDGTATITTLQGSTNHVTLSSTGNATNGYCFSGSFQLTSSGSVTNAHGFAFGTNTLSSTGAITNLYGFRTFNVGNATLVTNAMGFNADDMTGCVTLTAGFRGQLSSGTGKYNLYMDGSAANYLAGVTGIGVAPSTTTALALPAGTTGISSLRIPHGAAPTTPVNGDIWTTTAGIYVRINGATVGPLS